MNPLNLFITPTLIRTEARQYQISHIFVAEEVKTGHIAGVVCVGLKDVTLYGVKMRIGWLFDLRVDEDFQRKGIGARLNTMAETASAKDGAAIMFLSVNGDNTKAKAMYKKIGYVHASKRAPPMTILIKKAEEKKGLLPA